MIVIDRNECWNIFIAGSHKMKTSNRAAQHREKKHTPNNNVENVTEGEKL